MADSYVDDFASVMRGNCEDDDFASEHDFTEDHPDDDKQISKTTPSSPPKQSNERGKRQISANGPTVNFSPSLKANPSHSFDQQAEQQPSRRNSAYSKEDSVMYSTLQQPSIIRASTSNLSDNSPSPHTSDDYDEKARRTTNIFTPNPHKSLAHQFAAKVDPDHHPNPQPPSQPINPTKPSKVYKIAHHQLRVLHPKNALNHGITIASHNLTLHAKYSMSLSSVTAIHYPGTLSVVVGDHTARAYLSTISGNFKVNPLNHSGHISLNGNDLITLIHNNKIDDYIGYYDPVVTNHSLIGSVANTLKIYQNRFKFPINAELFTHLPTTQSEIYQERFTIENMVSLFSFSFQPFFQPQKSSLTKDDQTPTRNDRLHDDKAPEDPTPQQSPLFNLFGPKQPLTKQQLYYAQLNKLLNNTHVENLTDEDQYLITIIGFILARFPIIVLQSPPSSISMQNMDQLLLLLKDWAAFHNTTIVFATHSTIPTTSLVSINHLLLFHSGTVCFQGPIHDIITFIDGSGFNVPNNVDVMSYLQLLSNNPELCAEGARVAHDRQIIEQAQAQVHFELDIHVPETPQQLEENKLLNRSVDELEISPNKTSNVIGHDEHGAPMYRAGTGPDGELEQTQLDNIDEDLISQTKQVYSKYVKTKNVKSGYCIIEGKYDGWDDDSDESEEYSDSYDMADFEPSKTVNKTHIKVSHDPQTYTHDDKDAVAIDIAVANEINGAKQPMPLETLTGGEEPNTSPPSFNRQITVFPTHLPSEHLQSNSNLLSPSLKNVQQGIELQRLDTPNVDSAMNVVMKSNTNPSSLAQIPIEQQMNPVSHQLMTIDQEQHYISLKSLPMFKSTRKVYKEYIDKWRKQLPPELIKLLQDKVIFPTSWGYLSKAKYPCTNLTMLSSYYRQSVFYNVIEYDCCLYNALPLPIRRASKAQKLLQPCIVQFDVFSVAFLKTCIDAMVILPSTFFKRVVPQQMVNTGSVMLIDQDKFSKLASTPITTSRTFKSKVGFADGEYGMNFTPSKPAKSIVVVDKDDVENQPHSKSGKVPRLNFDGDDDGNQDQVGHDLRVIEEGDDGEDKIAIQPYATNKPKRTGDDGGQDKNVNNGIVKSTSGDFYDPISFVRISQQGSVYLTAASEFAEISRNDSLFHDYEDSTTQAIRDLNHVDKDEVENDRVYDPVSLTHVRYSKMYKNTRDCDDAFELEEDMRGAVVVEHREDSLVREYHDKLLNEYDQCDKGVQSDANYNRSRNGTGDWKQGKGNGNGLDDSQHPAHPTKVQLTTHNSSDPTKLERFALPFRKQKFFQWRYWYSTAVNMNSSDYSIILQFLLAAALTGLGFAFFTPLGAPDSLAMLTTNDQLGLRIGTFWYLVFCMLVIHIFSVPTYLKQHRHIFSTNRPLYTFFVSNLLGEQIMSILYSMMIGVIVVPSTAYHFRSVTGDHVVQSFAIFLALFVLSLFIIMSNRFIFSFCPYYSSTTLFLAMMLFHFCFIAVGAFWVPYVQLSSWLKWTRYSSPYNWIYYSLLYRELQAVPAAAGSTDPNILTNFFIIDNVIDFFGFILTPGWTGMKSSWYLVGIVWTIAAAVVCFIPYLCIILIHYSRRNDGELMYDANYVRSQRFELHQLQYLMSIAPVGMRDLPTVKPLLSASMGIDRTQEIEEKHHGLLRSLLQGFSYEPLMIAWKNVTIVKQKHIPTLADQQEYENIALLDPAKPRLTSVNIYAQPGTITLLTSPSSLVETNLVIDSLFDPSTHILHGDLSLKLQHISPHDALPSTRCHYTLIDGKGSSNLFFPEYYTVQHAIDRYFELYLSHVTDASTRSSILDEVIKLCDIRSFLDCKIRLLPLTSTHSSNSTQQFSSALTNRPEDNDVYTDPLEYLSYEQYLLVQVALGLLSGSTVFAFKDPFYYITENPHFVIGFLTLLRRLAQFSYLDLLSSGPGFGRKTISTGQSTAKFRYTIILSMNGHNQILPSPAFHLCDRVAIWTPTGELCYFGDIGKRTKLLIKYFEKFPHVSPFPSNMDPLTYVFDLLQNGMAQTLDFSTAQTTHILPTTPDTAILKTITNSGNFDEKSNSSQIGENYIVKPSTILKYRKKSSAFNMMALQHAFPTDQDTFTCVTPMPTHHYVPFSFLHKSSHHNNYIPQSNNDIVQYYKGSVHFERCMRNIHKIEDFKLSKQQEGISNSTHLSPKLHPHSNSNKYRPLASRGLRQLIATFIRMLFWSKIFAAAVYVWIPSLFIPFIFGMMYYTFGHTLGTTSAHPYLFSATFTDILPFFNILFMIPILLSSLLMIYYSHNTLMANLSRLHFVNTNPIQFFATHVNSVNDVIGVDKKADSKYTKGLFRSRLTKFHTTWHNSSTLPLWAASIFIDSLIIIPLLSFTAVLPYSAIVQMSWNPSLIFRYILLNYITTLSTYAFHTFCTSIILYYIRGIKSSSTRHNFAALLPRLVGTLYLVASMLFAGFFSRPASPNTFYLALRWINTFIPFGRCVAAGHLLLASKADIISYYTNNIPADIATSVPDQMMAEKLDGYVYYWINNVIIVSFALLFIALTLLVLKFTSGKNTHTLLYPNIKRFN